MKTHLIFMIAVLLFVALMAATCAPGTPATKWQTGRFLMGLMAWGDFTCFDYLAFV